MQKWLSIFFLSFLVGSVYAEEYTILFNSGTGDSSSESTKLEAIVYTSSDNCVNRLLKAEKVYRAKEGFGIKMGSGSAAGTLVLGLNAEYNIQSMTVYAAAYGGKNKDSVNAILVCGDTLRWQYGQATVITPYEVTAPGKTDSLTIAATKASNNRFYIQKIVFTANDPFPGVAKVTTPSEVNFGSVILVDGQPETDATNINIMARSTLEDSLQLRLHKGTIFSLSSSSLPNHGGDVDVAYTVKEATDKGYNIYDSLIILAKGINNSLTRHAIPITLFAKNYKSPVLPVDSSCMRIGAMPGNYYQPAQGLKDSLLKSALSGVIHCGPRYRYGSGKNHTWQGFFYTDRDTLTQQVLDMYSHKVRYFDLSDTCGSVSEFDIEHMLPKSWWGGDVNEAYCDLFHLVPADYSANRSKSNNAPGIPTDSTFNNGSFVTGSGSTYGLTRVFCPEDEYKGDFARAYFYIVTCYEELQWISTGDAAKAMTNTSYLEFRPWLQQLLLSWHRQDPVSEKEKNRAIQVNKIQGNRNPFIDYPELVEYIWGNRQGQEVNFYSLTQSFGDKYSDLPSAFEEVNADDKCTSKEMKDGQVLIIYKDKVYTITGTSVQE